MVVNAMELAMIGKSVDVSKVLLGILFLQVPGIVVSCTLFHNEYL